MSSAVAWRGRWLAGLLTIGLAASASAALAPAFAQDYTPEEKKILDAARTEGEVSVDGKDIAALGEGPLAAWRASTIGFVFQSFNLIPVLTAEQNVELPLLLTNLPRSERQRRARTALKVVGLEDRLGHYPRQLSGGQEQRVAIARAIVNDPKIIVADEPTGDLDRQSADDVLALLVRLNQELGKTILMVTHDPAAAERATTHRRLDKGVLV